MRPIIGYWLLAIGYWLLAIGDGWYRVLNSRGSHTGSQIGAMVGQYGQFLRR
ncbi:hypothetical protein [Plesiomonas sp. ZOR0011]|uniref:hypothetical protein n=1 Tax=Plesiomonas sp. ZOR0011 TaxID=1339230 RepID=UPI000AB96344|nr:hypothetical protein [Plesiomonas sp. ZOR0011]